MQSEFIDGYRLRKIQGDKNQLNWLFLPGGPGMGSEYLEDFVSKLNLPGNKILGDFPGDGSNRNTTDISYEQWRSKLLVVIKKLTPCILVTHSFSGMFALTIPELEKLLTGLVIISSAPDKRWMQEFELTIKTYDLPALGNTGIAFSKEPTDDNLRLAFIERIPYLFLPHEIKVGKELLKATVYNAVTRIWAYQHFHPNYAYTWYPQTLPTIIIGSKDDRLLPIKLFLEQEEWHRDNIQFLVLEGTGHFPWLSCFSSIQEILVRIVE
jgi:pimeloyl-ACP methyl ester carboxylesterase